MKIIFATTNERKITDIKRVIEREGYDIEILTLDDIGFIGEIEETGKTLEENSLIKAKEVKRFCNKNNINYTIVADDSGLFIHSLNNEPGIYTARYAEEDREKNPSLPKHECINKALRKLEGIEDRSAQLNCVITCITENNNVITVTGITNGDISTEIHGEILKPYFYSVFIPTGSTKTINEFTEEELFDTYRYLALKSMLKKISTMYVRKLRVE